jgi:hypothetical protein
MVAALLTGAVLGGGVTAAYAGTIDSANGFYTYDGRDYVNSARIETSPNYAVASTAVTLRGGNTPGGSVSARGRIYTANNALYCEGVNILNLAGQSARGYSCSSGYKASGAAWYSYGVTRSRNSSGGFASFFTLKTNYQYS